MPCRPDSLVVGDVAVRQDSSGRYCLNDLHRAAGLEKRHQPSDFFRLASTKELIAELERNPLRDFPEAPPVVVVNDGRHNGTYVCKPLVYDYAMWVSATFRLRVIEAFDAIVRGVPGAPAAPQLPGDYIQALEALVVAEKEKLRLSAVNAQQAQQLEAQGRVIEEQRPAKEFVDRFVAAKGTAGVRQVAKRINRKQNELVEELLRDKVLYRSEGKLTPFSEYQAKGYFVVKNGEKNGKAFGHARFTPEGITWAGLRYGREAPGESSPLALPAGPKQSSQLALLPESTQP
ncbi:hypothetical protein [Myxococcus phage Mx4 ts27htf-1hrm-1]|nr:hypothetical protein Mx4_p72 [Myxococcus phage Mx4]WNM70411.1 hypothetical protein [Myxococcus phage Mx4 ts27htf-1hrm-1]